MKKSVKLYLWLHVGLLAALLLFPLYRMAAEQLTKFFDGCILHDRFFLYCPLCGGTRALEALLHLDLASALVYNPFVTLIFLVAVALDVVALIRLLKGQDPFFALPGRIWIILAIAMVLYAVARNVLMIAYGYDPTGDLGWFWQAVRQ